MNHEITGLPPIVTDVVSNVRPRSVFMGPDALCERLNTIESTKYASAGFTTLYDDYGQPVRPFIVESRHSSAEDAEEILYVKLNVHSDEPACNDTADELVHNAVSSDFLQQIGARALIAYSADDEGPRLSSGLFGQRLTLPRYFAWAFRNGAQPDWAYPLSYKGHVFQPDPRLQPGTLGSMKIIETYQPSVMKSGHNASLAKGVFWYASHDHPRLFDAYYTLARLLDTPISTSRELPYIPQYRPGISNVFSAKLVVDHGSHPGLGESSGGYLREHAPDTLWTFSEMPLFLSTKVEPELTDRAVAETIQRVEQMLHIGRLVLHAHRDEPPNPYSRSLRIWTDVLSLAYGESSMARKLVEEHGPTKEIFRITRMLSPALRLADQMGNGMLRQGVVGAIGQSTHTVQRELRPRALPVNSLVRMQMGTLALASLSQSGRL